MPAYPVVQTKTGAFSATSTPALTFDNPVKPGNAIVCLVVCNLNGRLVSSVADDVSSTYFMLGRVNVSSIDHSTFIAKQVQPTPTASAPTVTATLNGSGTGSMIIAELVDVMPGATLQKTLDPNAFGYYQTGSGTNIQTNLTLQIGAVRSVDNLFLVACGNRFSATLTNAAGWDSVQNGIAILSWKLSGAPSTPGTQTIGTSSAESYMTLMFCIDMIKKRAARGMQPAPFQPGPAGRSGMRGV